MTYVKLEAFSELACVGKNFTPLERCKGRKGAGVEPRIFEPKTPVHTVGSKFQGLLLDVIL